MMNCATAIRLCAVMVCILVVGDPARAGLLVYEPFQDYAAGALEGQTPNDNTIGLDKSVPYVKTPSVGSESLVTGLTLGSLKTAGGAEWVSTGSPAGTLVYVAAKLNHAPSFSGTLYSSYLVNIGSFSSDFGGLTTLLVNDYATTDSNRRFYAEADGRTATNAPGVRYTSTDEAVGSTALTTGATYLVLSKFTNVGVSLSGVDPGVATLWTLTLDQFADFVAAGRLETWLDTSGNVQNRATISQISGTYDFDSSDYVRMACYAKSGSAFEQATFDEIRYGTELTDVTPVVPEPGTLTLLTIGGAIIAAYACRCRKHA